MVLLKYYIIIFNIIVSRKADIVHCITSSALYLPNILSLLIANSFVFQR